MMFSSCSLPSLRHPLITLFWCFFGSALLANEAQAQEAQTAACLQEQVLLAENENLKVSELKALCLAALQAASNTDARITDSPIVATNVQRLAYENQMRNSFFEPYKDNYISFGSMDNVDGSLPFSGESFDIKFQLGMKFSLFPQIEGLSSLAPLKFGYSQRSWWDIAEPSAPFKEHNYNPEVFWDFTENLAKPSSYTRLHIFDTVGFEHQSNGRDGPESRSWDRAYATRHLRLSEVWSWTFKYWQIINRGESNRDIEGYLGSAEITTHFDLNNWLQVNLKTLLGRESDKLSYQVDLIVPMSQWVNSRFYLSYYNGFGEALINYNQKSTSLRAGFYFPLGF